MDYNYLKQSLSDDEELIHVARFHWMYTVQAVFNIVFGFILSIGIISFAIHFHPLLFGNMPQGLNLFDQISILHPGVKILSFFVFLMSLLRFAQMMIAKATTEIGISDVRLIYKRGLVARDVVELNTDRIEGVDIVQGVLGRLFGYGRLIIRGMGIGAVAMPQIEQPIRFKKAIEKARTIARKKGMHQQV